MSDSPARQARWHLHRGGIVNIWQYAEQTFDFSGGRAIFQGTNGSGKSRTLELLLPLCLDGELRQLGSKGFDTVSIRRLMLDDYAGGPTRIGYAWVELRRAVPGATPEAPETVEYLTCGLGVKASKASQQISDSWRFVTSARIGIDVQLVGLDRVPVTLPQLKEALGPDCVLEEAAFRARVADTIYGVPAARYGDLLHLQRTLRNPDVGLKVLEGQLEQILSDALPPLDPGMIERLATSFEDLESIRENISRLRRAGTALDAFLGSYSSYSHAALHSAGQKAGAARDAAERAARRAPLSAIPASPLMHSTGFIFASLPTLTAGGVVTTLVNHSFDAHELLSTVEAVDAYVVAIVGDAFALPIVRALEEGRPGGGRYDCPSMRTVVSAGVAWSAHIKERMLEHLDVTLLDACGSTEGLTYGLRTVRRGDEASTANFDAGPGLMVVSPEGELLPPGDVGLLCGTTSANGYFRDPEKSAVTFFEVDGQHYVAPGDLGRIEADGTVTLVGRGVTTINTGGEKVFPAEVEEAIRAVDEVDDCLVVGIPDERFGQSVAALVVTAPGADLGVDDVTGAVRASLAGYKAPRTVRFVDQVPRLPNGKIDYESARTLAQSG